MPRKLLTPMLALGALLAGLLVAVGSPAQAGILSADICSDCVTFDPVETHFSGATATVVATVEVDVPNDWTLTTADLGVVDPLGYFHSDWFKRTSPDDAKHTVVFKGTIPNEYAGALERGYLTVYPNIWYRDNNNGLQPANYAYPYYHAVTGDTQATLTAPDSIPTGSALTLSGAATCFRRAAYGPLDEGGWVSIGYRLPGGTFTYQYGTSLNPDGSWSFTVPAVGGTFEWQAQVWPNTFDCAPATSPTVTVQAGTGPPPPPPTLPGAPGLQLGQVTAHTVALDWSPPADAGGVTGYRFGWESASGLPQPSWSRVFGVNADDPFVMTNLCAGCRYTMWVEAVTATGTGARATVQVTTAAEAIPTTPPQPPGTRLPGKPRQLKGHAGSRRVLLTWQAPKKTGGAKIDQYCVHVNGVDQDRCVAAKRGTQRLVIKKLKIATYTFAVRAHTVNGFGKFSRPVKVRPRR
jgi:hypothetical protein